MYQFNKNLYSFADNVFLCLHSAVLGFGLKPLIELGCFFSAQTCAKERQIQLEEYSNLAIDRGSRKKKEEERDGGREGGCKYNKRL